MTLIDHIDTETGEIIGLSPRETRELQDCEQVIDSGLKTFVDVGNALAFVRDHRLYRAEYETFDDYWAHRWPQLTRSRVYQFMDGAGVVNNLEMSTNGGHLPTSERQARPLTELEPEAQRLAWEVVKETAPQGKVTAAHVKSVVAVLKDVLRTGAVDGGEGLDIPIRQATPTHLKAAVTEETYERMMRQELHIHERQKPKSNYASADDQPDPRDLCQTPAYALDPLLPYLPPFWTLWEPARGEGLLVEALYDSGFAEVEQGDVQGGLNFFDYEPEQWDCIVTNPPFSGKYRWLERCYALGKPFALLLPVETLGAKTAQELFRAHGVEVILMDQRIDFKMPNKGFEGSAQFPSAWFTWGLDIGHELTFAQIAEGKRQFVAELSDAQ